MKHILLLSFLFLSFFSYGQIASGTRTLGGNVGFSVNKSNDPNNNSIASFYINPRFGKARKENQVIGAGLFYQFQQNNAVNQAIVTQHQLGLQAFKQKYLPLGKGFMAFGEGTIGASYSWQRKYTAAATISAGLGAGLAYKANKKMMLTVSFPNAVSAYVGYNKFEYASNTNSTSTFTYYSAGLRSTVAINNLQFGVVLLH